MSKRMSQYYFKHRVSGEETGPFTREAIVRAIRELRHIDESIYKKVGQPEWKYAYEFPEFEKHHSRYIFIGEDGKDPSRFSEER